MSVLAALAALLLPACKGREAPRGLGRRVAEGEVLGLRASRDGTALAILRACEPVRDRTLPPGTARCDLDVVVDAGAPQRVARGVSTLPSGHAWSAAGRTLAALADYDHARGQGALTIWTAGAPTRLAEGVSFYAIDAEGRRVGWVADGRLSALDVTRVAAAAPLADGIATFEFGPDDAPVLARRTARAGGELLAIRGGAVVPVAAEVRDYAYARDRARYAFTSGASKALTVAPAAGARSGAPLGRGVQLFLFAPRGGALAFVADAAPGKQGDLWATPAAGGAPVRLASKVGEPRWSADGTRLAWLQDYDPRSRTGTLAAGAPGLSPQVIARNVSDFDLSVDGQRVAYLLHESAGGYSVDLGVASVGAPPVKVARGVFGFSFSPDGRWLYYRTSCVREAEACELLRVPGAGAEGATPERIAEGVKSFEYAPGRPDRLLVTWARKDRVALDLAVWEGGKLVGVDTYALPGSAQFLGGDPTRLAYVVVDPRRQGAYVAEVP